MMLALAAGAGVIVALVCARSARRIEVRDRARNLRRQAGPASAFDRWLAGALDRAALDLSVAAARQVWLAAGAAAFVVFAPTSVPLGIVAATLTLAGAPAVLVARRGAAARRRDAALPRAVEQLAAELRAGGTIRSALERLARAAGPLRSELARLHTRLDLGAPLGDALVQWAHESTTSGSTAVAGALRAAVTAGGPAADALDALAQSLDDRLSVLAETRALAAQARASAYVVGTAPIAYLAFAAVVDRPRVAALVTTGIGRACLALGLLLEALGVLSMHWLLREERTW